MNNEILIPIEFNSAGLPLGHARLTYVAKKVLEKMKINGDDYVFTPVFIIKRQDEDGTIREYELIELSLIPAARAVKK